MKIFIMKSFHLNKKLFTVHQSGTAMCMKVSDNVTAKYVP